MNHGKVTLLAVVLCIFSVFAVCQIYFFSNDLETSSNSVNNDGFREISLDNFLYLKNSKNVEAYEDVPYWASESAHYFKALEVFSNDANFNPTDSVTYLEFSQILASILGLETSNLEEYNLLATSEFGSIEFDDDVYLLREQAVFMLSNVIRIHMPELIQNTTDKSLFLDEFISDYALENFMFAIEISLINGDNSGKFNPSKKITKAELSAMLYNLTDFVTN